MINTLFVSVLQRWDRNLERIGKKQKKNNFMEDVFKLTRCSSFVRYLIKKILESHGNSRIIFSSKWCHQQENYYLLSIDNHRFIVYSIWRSTRFSTRLCFIVLLAIRTILFSNISLFQYRLGFSLRSYHADI